MLLPIFSFVLLALQTAPSTAASPVEHDCAGQTKPTTIVCIGDELTTGSDVGTRHAWPSLLEERLSAGFQVINLASD